LGLLAAVLSVDETALVQSWLSQPLPAGILAGLVAGDPVTGVALGLPLQLITVGNLPVGQSLIPETVGPVVGGVGAILAGGHHLLPLPDLQGTWNGALHGWILLAVVLASVAGHGIIQLERRLHFLWVLSGHRHLREGSFRGFERLLARCVFFTALRGFCLAAVWFWLFGELWLPLLGRMPERLWPGLACLPWLAVPLAVVVLMNRYGFRVSWPLGLLGFGVALGLIKGTGG
jgi:mannose/fructose/N-acetylgalactosamine-specific phosphotransferase system component IIC